MADVKFTGLSAVTPPINKSSLVAAATFDGVTTYTSEKVTISQLADSVFLMDAEQKITFDSSGTNQTVISDSNSNAQLDIGQGGNALYFTTDAGTEAEGVIWCGDDSTYIGHTGANLAINPDTSAIFGTSTSVLPVMYMELSASQNIGFIYGNNSVGTVVSDNTSDGYALILNSRNSTFSAGVTNSVILGGVGVVADEDDTAFTYNLEHQGTKLGFYGTTQIAKPTGVAVSAAGIHAALVSLGLIGV